MKNQCPACGGTKVAQILYGMPAANDEKLNRKLEAGEVTLGGCVMFENDPKWECTDCGHKWGRVGRERLEGRVKPLDWDEPRY